MRHLPALLLIALVCSVSLPAAAATQGGFVVKPPRVQSAALRAEAREMHALGVLQDMADALNGLMLLPAEIGLLYAQCDQPNAYYNPEEREILICLELMQGMAETLDGQFEDEDSASDALAGAFISVLLHEVGHALVDVLEIPITGREEDAVDQLSAWMLIQADDADSVLGAAATYYTDEEVEDDDFADEHSINKQRYFNLVCWAYGSDPENREYLLDSWELPEARALQCSEEYAQLDRSWSRLLAPHLRPDHGDAEAAAPRGRQSSRADESQMHAEPATGKHGTFRYAERDD